jgi:hypothetical protein
MAFPSLALGEPITGHGTNSESNSTFALGVQHLGHVARRGACGIQFEDIVCTQKPHNSGQSFEKYGRLPALNVPSLSLNQAL